MNKDTANSTPDAENATYHGELTQEEKSKPGPATDPNSTKERTINLPPAMWAYIKLYADHETRGGKKKGQEVFPEKGIDPLTGEGDYFNPSPALQRLIGECRRTRPFGAKGGRNRGARGRFVSEDGKQRVRDMERPQLEARIKELEREAESLRATVGEITSAATAAGVSLAKTKKKWVVK